MDCSAFTISFIGVLDDVYFNRKLSTKHNKLNCFLRNYHTANKAEFDNGLTDFIPTLMIGISSWVTPTNEQHV